jgi:hypothetical protein
VFFLKPLYYIYYIYILYLYTLSIYYTYILYLYTIYYILYLYYYTFISFPYTTYRPDARKQMERYAQKLRELKMKKARDATGRPAAMATEEEEGDAAEVCMYMY